MPLRYFQKGFNFSQDGPGNRLVYHLQGCNFRCPWCSNPEGMDAARPAREEGAEDAARFVISAKPMFFDGGGLTLTGGEATLQAEAALTLLRLAREGGVNTCMETNASSPVFARFLPLLDTLICDFKHPSGAEHLRWTGADNGRVQENIALAVASGMPVLMRIPLIHGVNDDDAALAGFEAFLRPMAAKENLRVEILRYHEYGRDKWKQIGREYAMKDAFVTDARAREFENALRNTGANVVHT